MRRFAIYLAKVVAMIIATSCTMNEFLEPTFPSSSSDNLITISPRITHYTDYDVTTRSSKEGDEAKVTSMAMALFPIDKDGNIQKSVYYQYNADGNMLFVLDRNRPPFTDSNGNEPYKDMEFVMYIIANMQGSGIPETSGNGEGVGWTPERFIEKYHSIEDGDCFEKIHDKGLPMIGMLGGGSNAYGDGNTFIFHPTKDDTNKNGLPTVDSNPDDTTPGVPTDNLEIPMRSLYAKFSFTINVDSEQEIVGNPAPRFDLEGYQVVNASSKVYLNRQLNVDNDQTGYADVVTSEFHNVLSEGLYAQGATKATFSFYVPERYLTPKTPASAYEYDFGENGGICTGYENIPGELKKYAQRFKPELVKGQNATHVAIKGTFTDHQKHVYNVTYRIYLGKDNYGDFNIIRNTHYNNFITIKGIDNSDDQSAHYDPTAPDFNPDAIAPISIDHRVSIERTTPLVVGLRRETLLDAHIEVRPLRLHLSGGDQDANPTEATVTLKKVKDSDPDLSTWIAMEKSGSTDDHITGTGTPSNGKRKFFTTNLIKDIYTAANVPDDGNIVLTVEGLDYVVNQTIWLYVDENVNTESRSAILSIQYDYVDPVTGETAAPEDYVITQHGLHKVEYSQDGGGPYYMERFEEYLYNYDVDDRFGQTNQDGMPWGLYEVQLSGTKKSMNVDKFENYSNLNENQQTSLQAKVGSFYDFYIKRYDESLNPPSGVARFAGLEFCKAIITASQDKGTDHKIGVLALNQTPKSAVEYCYNKNKRNADGEVENVVWYLPAIDEMEDVIVGAYNEYHEFQDHFYWSSQPSFHRCYAFISQYYSTGLFSGFTVAGGGEYYIDDIGKARATKAEYKSNQYVPTKSGVEFVPDATIVKDDWKVIDGGWFGQDTYEDVEFTVKYGFYKWYTYRGREELEGYDASNYDYKNAYIDSNPIWPEFGEVQQEGNKGRNTYARVRCLRKMN